MLPADNGIVLGIDENYLYRTEKLQLAAGDIIFLYTDGITEAFNQQKQMYTDERLHQCLKLTRRSSPKEIIQKVVEEVTSFAGNEPQSDDLTMMAARYHP